MSNSGVVTAATAQGPRFYQEDCYVTGKFSLEDGSPGHLLAVMDGHRGNRVAKICSNHISVSGFFSLVAAPDSEEALKKVIQQLDNLTREEKEGSTISLACILPTHQKASVAVLGDSPVIIVDRNGKIIVSPEHNVRTNQQELQRALKRGGTYDGAYLFDPRTGSGLQMSRALGNREMGNVLEHNPEAYSVELGEESIVILATDGLLDPSHGNSQQLIQQAVNLAKSGLNAEGLMAWAEKRGLKDNATVIVWKPK